MDAVVATATRTRQRVSRMLRRFRDCRQHTLELLAGLCDADLVAQSMADARPVIWHMAHTSWFFEAFVLERFAPAHRPCHLYVPTPEGALAYRRPVDDSMAALLDGPVDPQVAALVELGVQHEHQYQERMPADLLNLLAQYRHQPVRRRNRGTPTAAPAPAAQWVAFRGGRQAIGHDDDEGGFAPVCHISWFEADAFARWAGKRLPTEAEWEVAAQAQVVAGNFASSGHLRPMASRTDPRGRVQQLYGDVWEWTSSAYGPYPGFRPPTIDAGEYDGRFDAGRFVLRGGSCATPFAHMRASYRHCLQPDRHWQFTGLRLAEDR